MNTMLAGKLPTCTAPWLVGAPLTALRKKSGSFRPIAVGETLRRLASRLCCAAARPRLRDILLPYGQVGVGVKGGLEAAVHTTRSFISSYSAEENFCCLKVDMTNAFNECSRQSFLHRLHKELPDLFSWTLWSYQCAGELRFGSHHVLSKAGVQQGDPLGPLLFSLVVLDLLDEIANDVSNLLLQMWYLDDGTFIGSRESILSLLSALQSNGPKYGLHLNLSKCEVFWPTGNQSFPELPPEIRVLLKDGGAELLGSPIYGSGDFYDQAFQLRISKVLEAQNRLIDIDNLQIELHLLRSCLALPKINHLLHTVPPGKAPQQLLLFDKRLRHSLEVITHSSLSDEAWLQATLPIKRGGLGLREAQRTSSIAFISSCNRSRDLVSRFLHATSVEELPGCRIDGESNAKEEFLQKFGTVESSCNIDSPSQHALRLQVDNGSYEALKLSCTLRDQARLNTISEPHAGVWLRAVPNPNLGLAMSRHEFSIAVRLLLGITLFPAHPSAVRCKCGQLIDGFGDHLLGCRQIHLRSKCHDALRDVIFNALLVDDKGTLKEQRFSSDTSDRPGDVFHPNFLTGRPAYFDITVRNSFQPKFVSSSATAAGAAGLAGEMEKDAKYDVLVSASDALFYPLAVESFGA